MRMGSSRCCCTPQTPSGNCSYEFRFFVNYFPQPPGTPAAFIDVRMYAKPSTFSGDATWKDNPSANNLIWRGVVSGSVTDEVRSDQLHTTTQEWRVWWNQVSNFAPQQGPVGNGALFHAIWVNNRGSVPLRVWWRQFSETDYTSAKSVFIPTGACSGIEPIQRFFSCRTPDPGVGGVPPFEYAGYNTGTLPNYQNGGYVKIECLAPNATA